MVNNVYYKFEAQGDRIKLPTSKDYLFHIRQKKAAKDHKCEAATGKCLVFFVKNYRNN